MLELKPPTKLLPTETVGIFLAGSIEQNTAVDWQREVTKKLDGLNVTIYNPRRDDWDANVKQDITDPTFKGQVEWELTALAAADIIFMYLDPATKSPISMLEFGMFLHSGKLIVCCPEGFWRRGNIQVCCARANVPLYDSMDFALQHLLGTIRRKEVKKLFTQHV
jgi:hypothetical protein